VAQPIVSIPRTTLRVADTVVGPVAIVTATYLSALLIAELMLMTSGLLVGALAHAVLLGVLVMHYLLVPGASYRRLLLALALPSLMRLVGLTVPIVVTTPLIWLVATGTPTLVAALLCARATNALPRQLLRLPQHLEAQLAVAAGGTVHGLLAYLILRPTPLVLGPEPTQIAAAVVVLGVFVAFTEELIFRGIIQSVATDAFANPTAGMVVSAVAFATMYLASLSVPFVLLMLAIGLLFGWVVRESGSLWGVIGAHVLLSVGALAFWPFVLR
jgi:membrane protease YdiL (CAAX protease family)